MPQVEAYILREDADGNKVVLYAPGHYDYDEAVAIAKREIARNPKSGILHVVRATADVYGELPDEHPPAMEVNAR